MVAPGHASHGTLVEYGSIKMKTSMLMISSIIDMQYWRIHGLLTGTANGYHAHFWAQSTCQIVLVIFRHS